MLTIKWRERSKARTLERKERENPFALSRLRAFALSFVHNDIL